MLAKDIMIKPVHTVDENSSLETAAQTMLLSHIGFLPVTNRLGQLVGIVTDSDFNDKERGVPFSLYRHPQYFAQWMSQDGIEKMYADARTRKVREIMSTAVSSVLATDTLERVLDRILKTGHRRLPVMSEGTLVGIVSRHDLLKLMVKPQVRELMVAAG